MRDSGFDPEAGVGFGDARRVMRRMRPHAAALVGAAFLAGIVSLCEGAVVWLVAAGLRSIAGLAPPGAGLGLQAPASQVIGLEGYFTTAWGLGLGISGLAALHAAARFGRSALSRSAAVAAETRLRDEMFDALLRHDPGQLSSAGLGDTMSRLAHDASRIRGAVAAAVTLVQRPLSAGAITVAAAAAAPALALPALLLLPALVLVLSISGRFLRSAARAHLARLGLASEWALDTALGLRTVQAYSASAAAAHEYRERNAAQAHAARRLVLAQSAGPPLVEAALGCLLALLLAMGASRIASGSLDPGGLLAFLVALGMLREPLHGFAVAHGLWEEARGGLRRVWELLDRAPQSERMDHDSTGPRAELDARAIHLELRGVTVDRGHGAVLRGVDLRLDPGEVVLVEGASGAGKSTLVDVIAGFVRPERGDLYWNGLPSETWSRQSRSLHSALVDQAPWLGAGTVEDAIRLGRPGASRAELEAAARAAGLVDEAGTGLRGGLARRVGDGGDPLSGGERQRTALARALLRGAPLLLLDEPTAHLDPDSEARFLLTLAQVAAGRSVLIVSHSEALRAVASRLYRLEDGFLRELPMAALRSHRPDVA
jgi:ABC-type multidrug transport system fused ATPase/permease subunit